MKTLDVQALHKAIDHTLEQLKKQSDEMAKVKKSVEAITSLDDALKGKGGDAIRAFYEECHTPFLQFYETFIDEYESALKKIKNALNSLEPNHHGYISQTFLEHDLEQGLNAADRTTKHLVSKANAAIAKVSHIVDLPDLNDNDFHEQNRKALTNINQTIEKLHTFDREQTSALKTAENDLETMQQYIKRLEKMYTGPKIEIATYQKGSILKPDELDALSGNQETAMGVMLDKLDKRSKLEKEVSEVSEHDVKMYKLKKKLENASDSEEYIKIAKEIGYENLDSDQKLYLWLLEKKKYVESDPIGFVDGVKDNLVDTGVGLWDAVTHPMETLEGIGNAIIHPVDTFNIIKKDIEESFERDVINGDSYSRSHWFGYALTTVGTSIVGTKGTDKLSKVSKAGKIGKAGSKVKAASKQTIKASKEAVEKSIASFKKSAQRVVSKIKGVQIYNPFEPQVEFAGVGKVPYNVLNGEKIKEKFIQFAKKVSDISRKPFTGGNISVPWLNKEKYNAVEVKGKVKPKGNLKDVDRRIYQLKNIDFNKKHPNKNITNLELMKSGKAPIGEDGRPINLHHLIQKEPGTMLEILHTTHKKYHKVLHQLVEKGDSFRNNPELQQQYDSFRRKYWMWRAEQYEKSLKGGSQ
ncbi:T7SS effector LXG polymorphic toxin [Bacillus glycinifermentans]|uniref:T7SS effector LXG polymorphic toxin n=1 Tax=Bacillus glycinifermentans TaxID=1664069 RepID=UPI002DB6454B|nr:T7SS effector LXG polymorphic toxin [Bacillus glycinifermentans]MEC0497005.1 T7SS effector LXG polymorphic toxin [Bacillus glycinifermentans]MEC0540111.1 T7SS effector LXG polymorphic toxin [Bacillus glycinifermentans]